MSDPVIVAIETATEGCSAALCRGDLVVHRSAEAPRQHTARLLPMLAEVLAEAELSADDVDAVAFGRGPGAFAGVRLAASVAQGLCAAWQVPALAVSTLEALAVGAHRLYAVESVLTLLDARMGQVYWGAFRRDRSGLMAAQIAEAVVAPQAVSGGGPEWFGCGRGFATEPAVLPATGQGCDRQHLPEARDLLPRALADWAAGRSLAATQAVPVYLRDGLN